MIILHLKFDNEDAIELFLLQAVKQIDKSRFSGTL